ncbi:extracellular solute-binding protein [Microlunatus sp. GCM10028923]|uniref:extracellular solute-binding protein n=1 Tax=Microlunatus sp. GCM10028923 TaxID=3273400 RepID=UPI00361E621B
MINSSFGRRTLLAGAGATALIGTATGCATNSGAGSNTAEKNTGVKLPNYIEYQGVKPDLPGNENGTLPGFHQFPAERAKSVPEKPGGGETLSGLGHIYTAVPPGLDQNSYWKGLNERLGVNLEVQMVGNADWEQKFATVIAGNDLPDILQLRVVANFPSLLEKRFTKLDEFLAGDAIKEYPNLANVATRHWKSTVYNGAIYGIPIPRGAVGQYHFIRADLFDEAGVSTEPKGFDELLETAKALTDPKKRRWAFGLIGSTRSLMARMNGEPNTWREEGGNLTHSYETEEFRQTLADLITLWKAGVIHPDSVSTTFPFKQMFNGGTVAINPADGYLGWAGYIAEATGSYKLGVLKAYQRDGSAPARVTYGAPNYSITGLKKQDSPDKIKLILRVLNWLAAPFGTEEFTYRKFGEEGVDHTVGPNGDLVKTKTGTANIALPIGYFSDSQNPLYEPGRPEDVDLQHKYQSEVMPTAIANPTEGLFSNASATKNTPADKKFLDNLWQIVQGRKPESEVESLIKTWRSEVGDEMRTEFQDQLQNGGQR